MYELLRNSHKKAVSVLQILPGRLTDYGEFECYRAQIELSWSYF